MAARKIAGGILGAAGLITVLTLATRAVGFVRWLVQSWTLGSSEAAQAYETANRLPNVLFEVAAGGALAGAVVPLLAVPLARELRRDVDRTASALLGWTLCVLVPLALVVALLARPLAGLMLGSAVPGETQDLTVTFLRIFAVQIPLYGIGVVLSGILQAQQRFFWPALAPLLSSAVVITSYAAFGALADGRQNDPASLSLAAVVVVGWGTTAGVAVMSLCQLGPVLRSGVRLRPAVRFPPGVGRRARHLAAAGLGALLAQQVSVLVAVYLANGFGQTGTVNVYGYAQAVYFLPYAVLAVPLSTAVFPRLSERAGTGDSTGFAAMAGGSTRLVVAAGLVGAAVLVAAAPAATAVFSLQHEMPGMTGAITAFAPGLVGYALIFHVSRALYAVDQGRAAVAATASGWLVVSAGSVVGVNLLVPDGGDGPATLLVLAAASSIGMTVAGALLVLALRRTAGRLGGLRRTVAVGLLGATAGAAAGRLVTDLLLDVLGTGGVGSVVAGVSGGLLGAGLPALAVLAGDAGTWRLSRWATRRPETGDPGEHA